MNVLLKWRNKYSGEEGFVKSVSKANKYFINTWNKEEAKIYKGDKTLNKDLDTLESIGETKNNNFFTVEV